MVRKLPEAVYKRVYRIVPRLCVDVIIRTRDGIVLARRDIGPCRGMWHIPGGTVLFGERLDHAVKRWQGRKQAYTSRLGSSWGSISTLGEAPTAMPSV